MNKTSRDLRAADLLAISAVSLFLEIAFIRYINSTVQIISYFNNFVIISAFLGLGFGVILSQKTERKLLNYFPTVAFLFVTALALLGIFGVIYDSPDQVAWGIYYTRRLLPFELVVILVFTGNVAFFIPLGHQLGRCLQQFENRLVAYSYDLLGSLAGVIGFALMSYWGTEPWLWMVLAGIPIFFLLRHRGSSLVVTGVVWLLVIVSTLVPERGIWSPYYKVTTFRVEKPKSNDLLGYHVMVDMR